MDFLELLGVNPLWNHRSYLPAFLVSRHIVIKEDMVKGRV
jgi:hypothetical protein